MSKINKTEIKPTKNTEKSEENCDVLLDDCSFGNSTVTIIAAIILTMATIGGVGYWFHIKAIDEHSQFFEEKINGLESRVLAEIRIENTGAREISILQDKLKESEKYTKELESQKEELVKKLDQKSQELKLKKSDESEKVTELNTQIVGYEEQISTLNKQISELQKKTKGIY